MCPNLHRHIMLRARADMANDFTGGNNANSSGFFWVLPAMQRGQKTGRKLVTGAGQVNDRVNFLRLNMGCVAIGKNIDPARPVGNRRQHMMRRQFIAQ